MTTWRVNPFTNDLDDSGAIIRNRPIIGQSKSAQDLGDFLDLYHKPYYNPPNGLVYVDSVSGSDISGDGTINKPFETIRRALQKFGSANDITSNVVLADADGVYPIPTTLGENSLVNILGVPEVEETITSYTVDSISAQEGVTITIDRTPTLADNEWRGRILQGTWSFQLRGINIISNTGNTLRGVVTSRQIVNSVQVAPTGTLSLIKQPKVEVDGFNVSYSNNILQFRNVRMIGGPIFIEASGRVDFFYSEIANQFVGLTNARSFMLGCNIAMTGNAQGVIEVATGGELRLGQGTVLSNENIVNQTNNFVSVRSEGKLNFVGGAHFSGIRGILANSGNISETDVGFANGLENYFYPDCENGYIINDQLPPLTFNAPRDIGGNYFLPRASGEVMSDYYVVAQRGAKVLIADSTNVDTNTIPNAVSANGGVSASSQDIDQTLIVGGNPEASAIWDDVAFVDTDTTLMPQHGIIHTDTSGGDVTLTLDPDNLQNGSGYTIKNIGTNDVILSPTVGQINGGATATVAPNTGVQIYLFNNDWFIK